MPSKDTDPVTVPFCKPDYSDLEIGHLHASIAAGRLEGGGQFTMACEEKIRATSECRSAYVVPSCTAALEMMALILDLKPGDEVIMPSYTFVSTANAFAMRGAVPVFVDIDARTLNLCPQAAANAITERTRAIVLVHYGGIGCDMEAFEALASRHDLALLEDAAQALGSRWNGRALGSFGRMGAISFHHTKNISCGEGGALLINESRDERPAEFVRDKGTNRSDFLRGTESKYEWLVLGSSYLLSELASAVLLGQLERMDDLKRKRMKLWNRYDEAFADRDAVLRPFIPPAAEHNAHIFHLRLPDQRHRDMFCQHMRQSGIVAAPHYVSLHLTPGGLAYGRAHGDLNITTDTVSRLVRLPLFSDMSSSQQASVIDAATTYLDEHGLR
jgi:dTDP-4-amino-4,6-dideoxygalactose transaminase